MPVTAGNKRSGRRAQAESLSWRDFFHSNRQNGLMTWVHVPGKYPCKEFLLLRLERQWLVGTWRLHFLTTTEGWGRLGVLPSMVLKELALWLLTTSTTIPWKETKTKSCSILFTTCLCVLGLQARYWMFFSLNVTEMFLGVLMYFWQRLVGVPSVPRSWFGTPLKGDSRC